MQRKSSSKSSQHYHHRHNLLQNIKKDKVKLLRHCVRRARKERSFQRWPSIPNSRTTRAVEVLVPLWRCGQNWSDTECGAVISHRCVARLLRKQFSKTARKIFWTCKTFLSRYVTRRISREDRGASPTSISLLLKAKERAVWLRWINVRRKLVIRLIVLGSIMKLISIRAFKVIWDKILYRTSGAFLTCNIISCRTNNFKPLVTNPP